LQRSIFFYRQKWRFSNGKDFTAVAITSTLIKINGIAITDLKTRDIEYENLYSEAGRNMNGDVRATLIGWFPKIVIETSDATPQTQVKQLCALLLNPNLTVEWFDDLTGVIKTGSYYAGSFKTSLLERQRALYNSVSVSLVPLKNNYKGTA
jgi:hypothetical protein